MTMAVGLIVAFILHFALLAWCFAPLCGVVAPRRATVGRALLGLYLLACSQFPILALPFVAVSTIGPGSQPIAGIIEATLLFPSTLPKFISNIHHRYKNNATIVDLSYRIKIGNQGYTLMARTSCFSVQRFRVDKLFTFIHFSSFPVTINPTYVAKASNAIVTIDLRSVCSFVRHNAIEIGPWNNNPRLIRHKPDVYVSRGEGVQTKLYVLNDKAKDVAQIDDIVLHSPTVSGLRQIPAREVVPFDALWPLDPHHKNYIWPPSVSPYLRSPLSATGCVEVIRMINSEHHKLDRAKLDTIPRSQRDHYCRTQLQKFMPSTTVTEFAERTS